MERRLPLALFLSFVVVVSWTLLFPPERPTPAPQDDARRELPAEREDGAAPGAAAAVGSEAPSGARIAAEAPEEQVLEFGRAGEVGHYRMRVTNRGGALLELSTGTYVRSRQPDAEDRRAYLWRNRTFTEAERADPANWIRFLESVASREGPTGSLLLSAGSGARALIDRPLESALWQMEVEREGPRTLGVVWRYAPGTGVLFTKRLRPVPGTWNLDLTLAIEHLADAPPGLPTGLQTFRLRPAGVVPEELGDTFYPEPRAVAAGPFGSDSPRLAVATRKDNARDLSGPLATRAPLAMVGAHNKYFAVLLYGADAAAAGTLQAAAYHRHADTARPGADGMALRFVEPEVQLDLYLPERGQARQWSYRLYAGPKDSEAFDASDPANRALLDSDLAWFSTIGSFLVTVLALLERVVGNWGVAIILLTFLVRLLLFPLNRRSQTAMARYANKMKRIQPKLEEIKKRYEKEPQKLRQEQAKLMQEEGAFPPLGGCLPILLQLPIFIGLFSALRTSFDLRQAPFLGWITDLSRPDRLMYLGWNVPFIDLTWFNILPILMVVLWIWQQKTMPTPPDEQARRLQRMMLFMPVVMGIFLYNYASGLSLYMMTQSALGIFEQKVIKRFWPIDDKEVETKKGCGCAPFARAMQNMQEKQKEQMARQQALRGGKVPPRKKKR